MQDNDSGSERQSGWQPPEYVSPWASASKAGEASDAGDVPTAGGEPDSGDTIAFGPGSDRPGQHQPGYPQQGYQQPAAQQPTAQQPTAQQPTYQQPTAQQPAAQQPWFGQPRRSQPGYGEPGYGEPGYGPPGYGPPGYGPPPQGGYGTWGGGPGTPGDQYQWGGYAPPPPRGSRFGKFLAYVAVAALAAGVGAGAAIALNHSSTPVASPPVTTNPGGNGGSGIGQQPLNGGNGGSGIGQQPGNGGIGQQPGNGGIGQQPGNGGQGGSSSGTGPLNAQALAKKVDPGIVDVTSQLKYSGATAEGTGMVISPNGLVLTNNHVIDQATSVSATLVLSGKSYSARVVGYDSTDDVALLQLEGASGLKTVNVGDSGKVKVGQAVLALGNAGGAGGLPATAQGTVNGLNRTIQASDSGAQTEETLHGMLETNAPIQEGDSGGPLVNSAGSVVGMDTAANTSNFSQHDTIGTTGFAIPIDHAITIANQIANGHASATVHIGLAGFIGINVADASAGCQDSFGGVTPPVSSGALVCQVFAGTPAAQGGLNNGDVITSINGHSVATADALTGLTAADHPGDRLSIAYVDTSGAKHTTTVTLGEVAK